MAPLLRMSGRTSKYCQMSHSKPKMAISSSRIKSYSRTISSFSHKFQSVYEYLVLNLGLKGPFYNRNTAQKVKFPTKHFRYTKLVRQGGARLSYQEHEKTIQETLNYIEQHLKDDLPLQTLAKHAGYSRFHFHRIFKKVIKKSVVDYIRERRMTQAAKDLIHTDQRAIDIALQYRFGSQESFTRAFKKIYDMSPARYRRLLRNVIDKEEMNMAANKHTPTGWIMTGETPSDYETGLDDRIVHSGTTSAYLKSKDEKARGFATLMQQIKSDRYRGERLQFSAFVKSEDVKGSAGLWMRIDHSSGEVLAFDNMMNRPITGTNGWNHFSVVLDVPVKSEVIAFGILLHGQGHIWMDELSFKTVDESVPVTEQNTVDHLEDEPVNLNFEG